MVVGGEEDVRGMEGETEVNKSEFGMRFHGPQAGLLDHVDRLAQLACALLVTLPRLIPLPWVQLLLFLPGPRKQNCWPHQRNLFSCIHDVCICRAAWCDIIPPAGRAASVVNAKRVADGPRRQISRALVCKYMPIVNLCVATVINNNNNNNIKNNKINARP